MLLFYKNNWPILKFGFDWYFVLIISNGCSNGKAKFLPIDPTSDASK